jgi:hypothetical protein
MSKEATDSKVSQEIDGVPMESSDTGTLVKVNVKAVRTISRSSVENVQLATPETTAVLEKCNISASWAEGVTVGDSVRSSVRTAGVVGSSVGATVGA